MVDNRVFLDDWHFIRQKGRERYLTRTTLKFFVVFLILLVVFNFLIHSLDFTLETLVNQIFKNFVIALLPAAAIAYYKWVTNEKKYERLKSKEQARSELLTHSMRDSQF